MKNLFQFKKGFSTTVGTTFLSLTMFTGSIALFTSSSYAEVKKARSTNSFINSIGVVAHIGYNDTAYNQFDEVIKPRLKELGVRHLRTSVKPGDSKTIAKLKELKKIGIKFNFVMDPNRLSLSETLKVVKTFGNSVQSVEGPNEWNHTRRQTYKGKNFPEGVKLYQSDLYKTIKGDAATSKIPVLSPSLSNATGLRKTVAEMGKVDCDISNAHEYPGGQKPNHKALPYHLPAYRSICGEDKPLIATETGYHNAQKVAKSVSEKAAGKYIPRLLFEYYNQGFKRSYIYELIDQKPNPSFDNRNFHWGLLRSDGSKKPSFKAVRNVIDILDNSDVTTTTRVRLRSLDYDVKGDMTDIHQTLLQKPDGRFYLVLWQEVDSYDIKAKSDIKVPYRLLNIYLNTKISQAKIYKPNWKKDPVKVTNNPRRLKVGVADRIVILELTPSS